MLGVLMQTAAKILGFAVLSLFAAFVWWAFLPAPPPLPDRFLLMFEPIVMLMSGRDVHGAEELLDFWEVWCYVFVFLLLALATIRSISKVRSRVDSADRGRLA